MVKTNKNRLVRNALNANSFEKKYSKFSEEIHTVPDQTLSIRQILIRHTRGIPMPERVPIFEEEQSGIDPKKLELTDLMDLRDELLEETKKVAENSRKRAKKAYDDAIKEQAKQELAEMLAKNLPEKPSTNTP